MGGTGQGQSTGGATRQAGGAAGGGTAPHTRPGDQNALCIETDQA